MSMFGNFSQLLSLSLDDLQDEGKGANGGNVGGNCDTNATTVAPKSESAAATVQVPVDNTAMDESANVANAEALEAAHETIKTLHRKLSEARKSETELLKRQRNECQEKDDAIELLTSQLDEMKQQNSKLKSTNTSLASEIKQLKADAAAAAKAHVELSARSQAPVDERAATAPSGDAMLPAADTDLSAEVEALKVELASRSNSLQQLQERHGEEVASLRASMEASTESAAAAQQRHKQKLTAVRSELSESQEARAALEEKHREEMAALRADLEASHADNAALRLQMEKQIASLQADLATSNGSTNALQMKYDAEVASRVEALASSRDGQASLQDQHAAEVNGLKSELASLQDKYNTVCEKFKDTVRKLADTKTRFRAYDEEILQYRDSINSKERCGLLEKQSGQKELALAESKTTIADLEAAKEAAVKQVEVVRGELTACKKLADELQAAASGTEEGQKAVIAELHASAANLQQQNDAAQGQLQQMRATVNRVESEALALKAELERTRAALSTAEEEISRVRDGARRSEDVGQQLADYKKRAQQALKQATTSAQEAAAAVQVEHARREAVLQAEIADLQRENKRLSGSLKAAQDAVVVAKADADAAVAKAQVAEAAAIAASKVISEGRSDSDHDAAANATPAPHLDAECGQTHSTAPETSVQDATNSDAEDGVDTKESEEEDEPSMFVIGGDDDPEEEAEQQAAEAEARRLAVEAVARSDDAEAAVLQSPKLALPSGNGATHMLTPSHGTSASAEDCSSAPGSAVQPGQLYMVYQLQQQLQAVRGDYIARGLQLDDMQRLMLQEKHDKEIQQAKNAELSAFLGRLKAQMQQMESKNSTEGKSGDGGGKNSGGSVPLNLEYLKHCVFRFMRTTEGSEKRRLVPVIATLLQFTPQESEDIQEALRSQFGSSIVRALGSHSKPRRGTQLQHNGNNESSSSSGIEEVASDAFSSLFDSVFGGGGVGSS